MIQARDHYGLIKCGQHGCGAEFGFREYVDESGPRETARLLLDERLVRHTDAEGVIWEEPESRRKRRLRGLPFERRMTVREPVFRIRNQKPKPTPDLKIVEPPARIRCMKCQRVNFWQESVVA